MIELQSNVRRDVAFAYCFQMCAEKLSSQACSRMPCLGIMTAMRYAAGAQQHRDKIYDLLPLRTEECLPVAHLHSTRRKK